MRCEPGRKSLRVGLVLLGLTLFAAAPWPSVAQPDAILAPAFSPFGDVPASFGLDFLGFGELDFNMSTPLLTGLQLPAALNTTDGGWTNFTVPSMEVSFNTAFRVANLLQNLEEVSETEVRYVLSDVKLAIQAVKNISGILDECLGVVQTSVQVGKVIKTVRCGGGSTECPTSEINSTETYDQEPSPVSEAISETLKSPEFAAFINQAIEDRYEKCNITTSVQQGPPGAPPPQDNPFLPIVIVLIIMALLGILCAVMWCSCCMGCCCWKNAEEGDAEKDFLDHCHALVLSPALPLWVRIIFYALIAVNVGFFVSANVSLGATINIDYVVEGVLVSMPSFYDFSIAGTAIEMIQGGIYLLGIILLGFSVFWPYIKLVILAAMFSCPSSWVRPARRLSVMQWIDTLGKWSMFDVFALSGCMALFFIEVYTPENDLYPLGWYGIILSMTPVWGMFANLIAQIISQGLSIFGIWAHDKAYASDWFGYHTVPAKGSVEEASPNTSVTMSKASDNVDSDSGVEQVDSTSAKVYSPPGPLPPPPMPEGALMSQVLNGAVRKEKFTMFAKILVCVMLLLTFILVILGNFITGFSLTVVGLFGLIQERAIPGSSVRYFTPIFVAEEMIRAMPADEIGTAIGTWSLIIVMVGCTLVVPAVQTITLFCIWAVPMSLPRLKLLLKANEILASWQYMEVFLIAVVVGGIQIPFLCNLLVGDVCDPIQPLLDLLVKLGVMTHATCFNAQVTVLEGLWCLFFASIILYMCSVIIREAAAIVVKTYDSFSVAQYSRGLTRAQTLYYQRRADSLKTIGILQYVDDDDEKVETDKSATSSATPVASVVV